MWPRNTTTDRLGLDYPIVLAPMAGAPPDVDAVNAQGLEAGGHRGTFLETDPSSQAGLLPQIASTVRFL